jgi:hypothetical protein
MSGGLIFRSGNKKRGLIVDDDPIGRVISVNVGRKNKNWRYVDVPYDELENLIDALKRVHEQV